MLAFLYQDHFWQKFAANWSVYLTKYQKQLRISFLRRFSLEQFLLKSRYDNDFLVLCFLVSMLHLCLQDWYWMSLIGLPEMAKMHQTSVMSFSMSIMSELKSYIVTLTTDSTSVISSNNVWIWKYFFLVQISI